MPGTMTSRERVLAALHLKQPDRVPFVDSIDAGIARVIMGREDFTPVELAEKLHLDAIYLEDYLPPLFCLRQEIDGINEVVDGFIKTEEDLRLMEFPNPHNPAFYDKVKRFVDSYKDSGLAIFAKIRLGASPTILSMGWTGLSYALYDNPKLVREVIERFASWTKAVVEHLNDSGIDFLMAADDIAYKTGPMISPQVFREIFLPAMREAASAIKLPWVYHSDGNLEPVFDDLLTLGMNAIHPFEPGAMDIVKFKKKYGHRICIMGNIDLHYTLTQGTVEEVVQEVKERLAALAPGGGYIIGSANGIANYCKVENVLAMAETIWEYGAYPIQIQ